MNHLRIGVLGAILGGLAIGGAATYMKDKQAPQTPVAQGVPGATVPGYSGPVYDAQGKMIGYAQPANPNGQPVSYGPDGQPVYSQGQAGYGQTAAYPQGQGASNFAAAPVNTASAATQPTAAAAAEPVAASTTTAAPVVVKKKRSTKKSVAIVAGSAGAGAAIGALAGGGKGAGIGALTGGAAGFIYDRMTHNK